MKEWESNRKIRPVDTFDLKKSVDLLFGDLVSVVNYERPIGNFKAPRDTNAGVAHYFDVGEGAFQSTELVDASSFQQMMNDLIADPKLQALVRAEENEKVKVYEQIDIFKRGFLQIEDDFKHGYENLKGSCRICNQIRRTG